MYNYTYIYTYIYIYIYVYIYIYTYGPSPLGLRTFEGHVCAARRKHAAALLATHVATL